MPYYKTPMLIDAIRLTDRTLLDTVSNIIQYLKADAGGWNHQRACRFMRYAFDGATDQSGLIKACLGDGRKPFADNAKILEATVPEIVGRKAQSFAFPRTKIAVTPSIHSAIGPAFFIVEDGVVRLVYLHARNTERASLSDLAALAVKAKEAILDNDFFGLPGDIEVHVVDKTGSTRHDEVLSLRDLKPHLREPVDATLARFAEAFSAVNEGRLAGPLRARRERPTEPSADEPTFPF